MVSAPSISVPVECVNICKFFKGDGSGRYDCSAISCAGKAPRALTGFLASTTHSSAFLHGQNDGNNYHRCEVAGKRSWLSSEVSVIFPPRKLSRSSVLYIGCRKWVVRCSSSSPSGYDELSPELLWEDLKPAITYLTCDELELVHDAFKLAFEAHDGQKRRSGEPFIIHPVEVARILGELELDWESIAAGLLHDTVEDTNVVTFERIEKEFGVTVRHIVEGETKVSKLGKLKCKNEIPLVQDVKAHDLRQMFLAMTEEASHEKKVNTARVINTSAATSSFSKVRVIIVKLADRLHNMRTLSHMPLHKQSSIASETLQVFAPLAKLLGMYQIKSELENLSFMYTNPQDYGRIKRRVAELYNDHEKEMEEANKLLIKKIEDDQFLNLVTLDTEVRSVCKEPYSIYKSVLKSRGSINEVNQIAQLRIIVKPKPGVGVGPLCNAQQICYHVLGLVHGTWTPIPRAMKDYIATSKPNGYQSLHTIVIPFLYESTFRLEVQIRTEEMNLIANRGIAAHYSGKVFVKDLIRHTVSNEDRNLRGKTTSLNNANVALRIGWLNAIREWQEEFVGNMSSREFVDTVTKDLLGSRVFVFTPRGEIKNLPKGATVVDYAYMIHTEIGNKMVAAKVNGNLVPPLHVLANAEVVEIVTYNGLSSKTAFQRHKQWLQHAKTRSARHKIMKFLREQAALSASEITADSVNEFVADTEDDSEAEEVLDYSKGTQHTWEKILKNVMEISSSKMVDENLFKFKNGTIQVPKVNGNHNKHMQQVSLKTDSQGNELGKMMLANIPMYKEVLPSLESWLADKVASWSNLEGHSIQWLCIVCIDRKGMMADTTIALADAGIGICSCAAEVDRVRGMAVILFHVDASLDNMASACSRMDLVLGVLGWSTGCTWPSLAQNQQIREC